MKSNIATATDTTHQKSRNMPSTPRGRALYTIDWFLNGKPVLRNHDNPQLSIANGRHC